MSDTYIDGLLAERAGLVRRGLADRVAQVDAQLKARKYDTSDLPRVSRDNESPTSPPRDRRSPAKADSTAAKSD